MKDLPAFLDMPTTEQDKVMKEFNPNVVGIPINDNRAFYFRLSHITLDSM